VTFAVRVLNQDDAVVIESRWHAVVSRRRSWCAAEARRLSSASVRPQLRCRSSESPRIRVVAAPCCERKAAEHGRRIPAAPH
jgi:hypothetical protein